VRRVGVAAAGRRGSRRRGGRLAGRDRPARVPGADARSGRPQLLLGPEHRVLRAGPGAAGAAPLPAHDHLADPHHPAGADRHGHPRPGRPAAAAVRRPDPGGLGRLGHAGDTGHLLRRRAGGDPVLARARGPLAQHRQVGGDGAGRPQRPRPDGAGRRRPDRRAGRGGPGSDDPAGRLPLVHSQRGLPDHLPGRERRPPRRRRGQGGGDPARPGGSARPGRHRGQAVRPVGVGRLHPAADHRPSRCRSSGGAGAGSGSWAPRRSCWC
jgi:hypothetical protein